MKNIILLCDSSVGVNIPSVAYPLLKKAGWELPDVGNDLSSPDNEFYWDAWDLVLNNARLVEGGREFTLHQNDDLFAVCIDSMTPTEYYNIFGEFPEWYNEETTDDF